MKAKSLRVLEYEGKQLVFSISKFNQKFLNNARHRNIKIGVYEQDLADSVSVDKSAVHNWRMGLNGPGDISKITDIAEFLQVSMWDLVEEVNVMQNNNAICQRRIEQYELDAIYRVGKKILIF